MSHNPKAVRDRQSYADHMRKGNHEACLEIEVRHGLAGYSPQAVLTGLDAILDGDDPHVAIERQILGARP